MTPRIQVGDPELDQIIENTRHYLGIDYSGRRRTDLRRRLLWLMEERKIKAPQQFLEQFTTRPWPIDTINAISPAVTVGETYFLRDPQASQWLRTQYLPLWIEQNNQRDCFNVWSAGCCSGEEAWSIYFLIHEIFTAQKCQTAVNMLATDINTEFLKKAKKGWYPPNSFRIRDEHFRARYFQSSGRGYQIQPTWLTAVKFQQWNLHAQELPMEAASQDLICCRNVLIYFAADEAEAVIRQFLHALRPEGVLLIGAVEASVATQAGLYGSWAGDNYVLTAAALTSDTADFRAAPIRAESRTSARNGSPGTLHGNVQDASTAALLTSFGLGNASRPQPKKPVIGAKKNAALPTQNNKLPLTADPSWRDEALRDLQQGIYAKREQWLHDQLADAKLSAAKHAEICLWLALASHRQRLSEASQNWLNQALLLQQNCIQAYVLRAQFAAQAGDHRAAQQALQQALYLEPDDIEANLCAAQLAAATQQSKQRDHYLQRTLSRLSNLNPAQRFYFSDGMTAAQLKAFCLQILKVGQSKELTP